jgi:hypothetical protein
MMMRFGNAPAAVEAPFDGTAVGAESVVCGGFTGF